MPKKNNEMIMLRSANRDLKRRIASLEATLRVKETAIASLQENELRYQQIYKHMATGVAKVSLTFKIEAANDAYCRMLGYCEDELIGKSLAEITHPDIVEENLRRQARLKAGEIDHYRMEKGFIHKQGHTVYGIVDANLIRDADGTPIYFLGCIVDITDRKRAEEALKAAKAKLETDVENRTLRLKERNEQLKIKIKEHNQITKALEASERRQADIINFLPDATLVIDREEKVIAWNRAMEEMTGIPAGEMLGKGNYEYAIPFYGERRPILIDHVFQSHKELEEGYTFIEKKRGTLSAETFVPSVGKRGKHLYGTATALCDAEGRVAGAIESIRDVTRYRLAEKILRESEAQYRSLVENIGIGIALISPDMKILALNRQMKHWFPAIDETRMPFCYRSFITPPKDTICSVCPVRKTFTDGRVHEAKEVTLIGGIMKSFRIISSPIKDEHGNVMRAIKMVADITEKKALQAQLIRSERLIAAGQLASAIAHEINSPLQGITSLLSVIQRTHQADNDLLNNLDLLKAAFGNIRNIVKNLIDLNRPGKEKKELIRVNTVIDKTIALLRHHLKEKKVSITFNPSLILPEINASPQQLSQVLMNLIHNADEAIRSESDSGGEISITTLLKDDTVIIQVADTGPGIPEEALQHIFDPFYTRKKTMGTGVGLSICHDIIKEHQGTIVAENSPDGGAVFTITLPLNS